MIKITHSTIPANIQDLSTDLSQTPSMDIPPSLPSLLIVPFDFVPGKCLCRAKSVNKYCILKKCKKCC